MRGSVSERFCSGHGSSQKSRAGDNLGAGRGGGGAEWKRERAGKRERG